MGEAKRIDEDEFWVDDTAVNPKARAKNEHCWLQISTVGPSRVAPLLYRRKQVWHLFLRHDLIEGQRLQHPKALVTRKKPDPPIATDSPPVTSKTRSLTRRALRDSPDNPFLATPEKHIDTPSPSGSSANPSSNGPLQERSTIAYVFRGV
ncbi:hypothetical protein BYT27DRAFT_6461054 [Phlegmacium glaucopus]|nr:hypothetical protein BYT27DRAFT_6461054 [Phlegmacium glaucopus]